VSSMTNKHADMVSCLSSFFFMGALYNYWWSQHCLCGLAYTPATMSGKISKQGDILYHLAREASPARNAAMRILRRGGWYHAPVVPVLTSILYAAHVVVAVISRKHLWNHAPVVPGYGGATCPAWWSAWSGPLINLHFFPATLNGRTSRAPLLKVALIPPPWS
jgi:hypothetical protein